MVEYASCCDITQKIQSNILFTVVHEGLHTCLVYNLPTFSLSLYICTFLYTSWLIMGHVFCMV